MALPLAGVGVYLDSDTCLYNFENLNQFCVNNFLPNKRTINAYVSLEYLKYGEWLGCHMIGMNVTENIAEAVVARKLETTAHEILNTVHPHPTMSEGLKEATAVAYGEAIDI